MMRQMRKAIAMLAAICVLCSTYGNYASAAETQPIAAEENETADTVESGEEAGMEEDPVATETEEDNDSGKAGAEEESGENKDSDSGEDAGTSDEKEETNEGNTEESEENAEDDTSIEENLEVTDDNDSENNKEPEEVIEAAEAALMEADSVYAARGEVSRIQWFSALVDTFDLSVAEDNYPDNYYSDIDDSSTYYRTVMLATEFGLVDVEAGEAFEPEAAATREVTAHTLNFCLGFTLEEESYSFSEADEVSYPEDIQIAIDRGWFQISNGSFSPDAPITSAEQTKMIADAKNVLAERKETGTHSNSYTFAEGVIDLTGEDTIVTLADADILTFQKCPKKLEIGSKYGIELDGFPMVFEPLSVAQSGGETVVQFETVPLDEAFAAIDMQGGAEIDLATVQAYSDDVELHYIVGGTEAEEWEDGIKYDSLDEVGDQEISAVEAIQELALSDQISEDFDLAPGVKVHVSCKVSDIEPNYDINFRDGRAHVGVNAKVITSCSISADMMKAMGFPSLTLIEIPIATVGYFSVGLDMKISGEAAFSLVENVSLGLYYENNSFRLEKNFSKDSFTIQTKMEIRSCITARLGMSCCNMMSGSLYAEFGVENILGTKTYNDGKTPNTCAHHRAWLFASVGARATENLTLKKHSWSKDYSIYTESNSPVRVSFHYEDGVAVPACTRGTTSADGKGWGYYTPANSKYGYNGASTGTGSDGKPYTVFEYTTDKAGLATITKYNGNVSALSIPKTLDGYTVVKIADSVFANNKMLRVVVIPDTVTEVGYAAFKDCTNLSQVTLSKKLETLGAGVFRDCDSLRAIEIPKSLKSATAGTNGGPFGYCDGLKEVTFEKGTTKIASC
ncbi:MAG: leucine-rich repeat protein, partial [Eubacterium sp.]|nr:leucine-rich repeat protein [Eubacterium sp.]